MSTLSQSKLRRAHLPLWKDRDRPAHRLRHAAARNAKLAEALGLNPMEKGAKAEYPLPLVDHFLTNRRACEETERAFADFIHSPRHGMVLPSAGKQQRDFELALAPHYNLIAESLDGRSTSLRRQQTSKIPSPTLSQAAGLVASQRASGLAAGPSRPTALGQLKRPESFTTSTGPRAPLNAILLEKVFGHDATSLEALLHSRALKGSAIQLRWIGDEDVVVTSDTVPAARLLAVPTLAALRQHAKTEHFAASVVAVAFDGLSKRVIRKDDGENKTGSTSASASAWAVNMSRTGSASGSGTVTPTHSAPRAGGWAAVASGALANKNNPSRENPNGRSTSAWESLSGAGVPRPSDVMPATARTGGSMTLNPAPPLPAAASTDLVVDSWDADDGWL
ncbi:hypothetical protein CBOM_02938 [Ceraceosorus bombacis]|uniref:Uncharacterized protein n=1 Tax=Ceraceosorus bombacis TaxID=401625 RepID=A0A0P1BGL9_9BASI|nr:hypothetical protein CBOM_02938 [Ceraceosorus bombacis]